MDDELRAIERAEAAGDREATLRHRAALVRAGRGDPMTAVVDALSAIPAARFSAAQRLCNLFGAWANHIRPGDPCETCVMFIGNNHDVLCPEGVRLRQTFISAQGRRPRLDPNVSANDWMNHANECRQCCEYGRTELLTFCDVGRVLWTAAFVFRDPGQEPY